MLNAFIVVLTLLISITTWAQASSDDTNLEKPTPEELASESPAFNKICVSANCYPGLSSGWDVGQCSSPPILPEGSVDPCEPAKTAATSTEANETAR